MRVLETDPSISYKMGKNKKHRIRKAKENEAEDSSEDGTQGCPHVSKAVNLAAMRKVVLKPTVSLGECSTCSKESTKSTSRDLFGGLIEGPEPAAEEEGCEPAEATVCICLQCGHQGCDRNSVNKHALKHYKTPHSGPHSIIVNLTTWTTWCYMCDEEVPPNPRIQGCIDFLYKQAGLAKPEPSPVAGQAPDSPVAEAASPPVNTPTSKSSLSCVKVKGLSNLGNTCFFNAVMQSMCQTRGLESLLVDWSKHGKVCTILGPEPATESDNSSDEEHEDEPVVKKPLSSIQTLYQEPGPITVALLNFLQEMKGGTTRNGTVNPNALFTQVCKKAPRFKGFQQQDSHELLRYLIDCVRMEEVKRGQLSILKFFKLPENINPRKVDEETKMKIKEYGRQAKHTFLDSLFGGQLVSTVKCEECKNVSQVFETFLDLSLPVMEEKPQRPNLILIGKKKDSVVLGDLGDDVGGAVAAASAMGLDGLAEKPSKYQERKNKKMAKRESKKKSKLLKSKSHEETEVGSKCDGEEKPSTPDHDNVSEDSNKTENNDNEIRETEGDGHHRSKLMEPCWSSSHRGEDGQGSDVTKMDQQLNNGNKGARGPEGGVVAVDSSPGGSNDGLDLNGDMEGDSSKDDPSDADIEDNLECDPSRREIHQNANAHSSEKLLENSHILNSTHEESSVVTDHDATISIANSLHDSVTPAIANHTSDDHLPIGTANEGQKAVADLSAGMTRLDMSSSSMTCDTSHTASAAAAECDSHRVRSISCTVSVSNHSDIGQLTENFQDLNTDDHERVVTNGPSTIVTAVLSGDGVQQDENDSKDLDSSQISATFNLSLPVASDPPVQASEEGSTSHQMDKKAQIPKDANGAEREDHHGSQYVRKTQQKYLKEARNHSMSTLAPRYHPAPKECSVMSCLNQFTAAELLTGSNKVSCKECTRSKRRNSHSQKADKKGKDTVYSNANKQYLIFRPPAVLTLHLKRFEQTGLTSRKVNRHVDFPTLLDLAPYCSSLSLSVKNGQSKVLYSLYGVVEHSGRLNGGHYTAYIKVRPGLCPHTQFLHTPSNTQDMLSVYMERVLKNKESGREECGWKAAQGPQDFGDGDVDARAESMVPPGRWFHISDSRVYEVTEAIVLKAQAYLLFYERIF